MPIPFAGNDCLRMTLLEVSILSCSHTALLSGILQITEEASESLQHKGYSLAS